MARSKSSAKWLREHFSDQYVKSSNQDGYRSRASYKLMALDDKDRLFRKGQTVVDLGAAPGGWSQVAAERVGPEGLVLASDILPMDPLPDVTFIQGDFTEMEVYERLQEALAGAEADLVISDMAPNLSGVNEIDQPASIGLVELALDMAKSVLRREGVFVAKVFQGEGFDALLRDCKASFQQVVIRKPDASRARSREVYLVSRRLRA